MKKKIAWRKAKTGSITTSQRVAIPNCLRLKTNITTFYLSNTTNIYCMMNLKRDTVTNVNGHLGFLKFSSYWKFIFFRAL